MQETSKLIIVLIDGLSADYFAKHRRRLRWLSHLAERGTLIKRMAPTMPGTSMPGRASILTGLGPREHGIYGNRVLDGANFRCVTPEDVRAPTLASRCFQAGQDVASIGFGLVHPDTASVFEPPWWLHEFLHNQRHIKVPSGISGRCLQRKDPHDRLTQVHVGDLPEISSASNDHDRLSSVLLGLGSDQVLLRCVADLACSDSPPDLILTEIATTDYLQHFFGCESDTAHWAMVHADMLVGALISRLEAAGRLDTYAIAIVSDHGFGEIETAIYPNALIPEYHWGLEGATLHVAISCEGDRSVIIDRLSVYGVVPHDSGHVPDDQRERVATFSAPEGHAFEYHPSTAGRSEAHGPPAIVATHGLRPGTAADDRVCILGGGDLPKVVIDRANDASLTATFASLLGLKPFSDPIF
ncbi:MAG: alkaline phosphatase family protein [Kiloniellales bacterium]|nr:alkaline phosphatase family protein [Kiloniellales bacterium]